MALAGRARRRPETLPHTEQHGRHPGQTSPVAPVEHHALPGGGATGGSARGTVTGPGSASTLGPAHVRRRPGPSEQQLRPGGSAAGWARASGSASTLGTGGTGSGKAAGQSRAASSARGHSAAGVRARGPGSAIYSGSGTGGDFSGKALEQPASAPAVSAPGNIERGQASGMDEQARAVRAADGDHGQFLGQAPGFKQPRDR